MTAPASPASTGFLVRIGNWFFTYRNYAFPLVLALVLVGLDPVPLAGDGAADRWLDTAGVALCVLGSAFRFWVIGLAYIKRGGLNKRVYAEALVTSGMFGVCRNPLYLGNALVLIGLFLIHNNPLAYAIGAAFFGLAYAGIIAAEERYLADKFGAEYARYCAAVPRFLPRFSRYAAAAADMDFDWRRAVLKDHGSVYAWIVAAAAIELLEHVGRPDPAFAPGGWWREIAVIGSATIVLVAIRLLKKSGLLVARS